MFAPHLLPNPSRRFFNLYLQAHGSALGAFCWGFSLNWCVFKTACSFCSPQGGSWLGTEPPSRSLDSEQEPRFQGISQFDTFLSSQSLGEESKWKNVTITVTLLTWRGLEWPKPSLQLLQAPAPGWLPSSDSKRVLWAEINSSISELPLSGFFFFLSQKTKLIEGLSPVPLAFSPL